MTKTFSKAKGEYSKGKSKIKVAPKQKNIKCFKCQGHNHYAYECPKKIVMLKGNSEIEFTSGHEKDKGEANYSKEQSSEGKNGEAFTMRRVLNVQDKEENEE